MHAHTHNDTRIKISLLYFCRKKQSHRQVNDSPKITMINRWRTKVQTVHSFYQNGYLSVTENYFCFGNWGRKTQRPTEAYYIWPRMAWKESVKMMKEIFEAYGALKVACKWPWYLWKISTSEGDIGHEMARMQTIPIDHKIKAYNHTHCIITHIEKEEWIPENKSSDLRHEDMGREKKI